MRKHNHWAAGAIVALLLSINAAWALTIVATPTETSGGFRHNVFHAASGADGASGSIYAWLDLDTSMTSTWDPLTGELTIHLEMFSDSGMRAASSVGFVTGTSTNLLGANFNVPDAQDGGTLGTISWDFDAAALAYIEGENAAIADNTSQTFIDDKYTGTTALGYQPNSYANGAVALWGADSAALIGAGPNFDVSATTFGTDLVFEVVPIPAAAWFFGSALGLLSWIRRKTSDPLPA